MKLIISLWILEQEDQNETKPTTNKQEKQTSKKSKPVSKARLRTQLSSFTHKWLAGSLKGHGARITDMDFSPNGKYVITVAEGK